MVTDSVHFEQDEAFAREFRLEGQVERPPGVDGLLETKMICRLALVWPALRIFDQEIWCAQG